MSDGEVSVGDVSDGEMSDVSDGEMIILPINIYSHRLLSALVDDVIVDL